MVFFLADAAQMVRFSFGGACYWTLSYSISPAKDREAASLYNLQSGKQAFELCSALRPIIDTLILWPCA